MKTHIVWIMKRMYIICRKNAPVQSFDRLQASPRLRPAGRTNGLAAVVG
jgi:hypothetical protein